MTGSEHPESGMRPKKRKLMAEFQLLAVCLPHCIASGRPHEKVCRNQPTEGHVGLTEGK